MNFLNILGYDIKWCVWIKPKMLYITILMILFLKPFLNGQNRLLLSFTAMEDSVYFNKNVKKQFIFEGDSNLGAAENVDFGGEF